MLIKSVKKQQSIRTLYKPVHPNVSLVVLVSMVLLTVILLFIAYAGYHITPQQPEVAYSTPTPSLTPTIALSTYTSPALGISFSYPTVPSYIKPHEVGSKIFFGS